jgi:hypothetical protein
MSEWTVTKTCGDGVTQYDAVCADLSKQFGVDIKDGTEEGHYRLRRIAYHYLGRQVFEADNAATFGDCEDYGLEAYVWLAKDAALLLEFLRAEFPDPAEAVQ